MCRSTALWAERFESTHATRDNGTDRPIHLDGRWRRGPDDRRVPTRSNRRVPKTRLQLQDYSTEHDARSRRRSRRRSRQGIAGRAATRFKRCSLALICMLRWCDARGVRPGSASTTAS